MATAAAETATVGKMAQAAAATAQMMVTPLAKTEMPAEQMDLMAASQAVAALALTTLTLQTEQE